MQTTSISRSSFLSAGTALSADGPRVVERSRGTAHPTVPTTRPILGLRGAGRRGAGRRS